MPDPRLELALAALRRLEDAVATVDERQFGAVLRCAVAPTLAPLNLVRVDDIAADGSGTVAAARAAAKEHGLTTIALDAPSPVCNPLFEGQTDAGEWYRVPRSIYVCELPPNEPAQPVERVTLADFVQSRRAFLDASETYDAAQSDDEEAAARLVADKVETQHWGAYADGELASVGEIYFIGGVAQLDSLSTLPQREGKGLGSAVTAARARAALARDVEMVFAQIRYDNERSIRLHEKLGFVRVGARTTFEFAAPAF